MQNCLADRGEGRVREAEASLRGPVFQQPTSAALPVNCELPCPCMERQRRLSNYAGESLYLRHLGAYVAGFPGFLARNCAAR